MPEFCSGTVYFPQWRECFSCPQLGETWQLVLGLTSPQRPWPIPVVLHQMQVLCRNRELLARRAEAAAALWRRAEPPGEHAARCRPRGRLADRAAKLGRRLASLPS